MDATHEVSTAVVAHMFSRVAEFGSVDEDWTGTTDQAKRRKLQNRLNQRARRRRIQESVQGRQEPSGNTPEYQAEHVHHTRPLNNAGTAAAVMLLPCRLGRPENRAALENFARQASSVYELGTPNLIHLADTVRSNVFLAFARNVEILGFDDGWLSYDAISPFNLHGPLPSASISYPATMCPTTLQASVEHHPWIDLFPCPRMRSNFLEAVVAYGEDAVNEDDLCHDVVDAGDQTGPDATAIIAWTDPWSPNGWEVTEKFLSKWSWLLYGCVELQEGTNAWRGRRGLERLRFPGC